MATLNNLSTIQVFKEVYSDFIPDLAKQEAPLYAMKPIEESEMLGLQYVQPFSLSRENGFTYEAAATGGSATLLSASVAQTTRGIIDGSNITGQSRISYEAIARAVANNDKKAFVNSTKFVVSLLASAALMREELMILHGQQGLGVISATANVNATTQTITLSDDTWSGGIWAGAIGATLDLWNAGLTLQINTGGAAGAYTISAVDVPTKTITVTAVAAAIAVIAVTQNVFWESASPTTEHAGLSKILTNTGTLFNISAASFPLWAGNQQAAVGTFSLQKVLASIALAASYGLKKDVLSVCATAAFELLNADQSALRMYDASYEPKDQKNGSQKLKFYGQTGLITMMPHPLQKDGRNYIFPAEEFHRIGATDLSFIRRHGDSEALILESATEAASVMRIYGNMACFLDAPRHGIFQSGITY